MDCSCSWPGLSGPPTPPRTTNEGPADPSIKPRDGPDDAAEELELIAFRSFNRRLAARGRRGHTDAVSRTDSACSARASQPPTRGCRW